MKSIRITKFVVIIVMIIVIAFTIVTGMNFLSVPNSFAAVFSGSEILV